MKPVVPMIFACALSVTLVGVAQGGAAEKFRQLRGSEIRSRLAGMEITDEVHWTYVFGRNGRLTSVSMGKQDEGRWEVDKDQLCLKGASEDTDCYQVWTLGNRVELRRPGALPEEGVLQKPRQRN